MKLNSFYRHFAFAAAVTLAAQAYAVPARPTAVAMTNPDGNSVEVRIHGDENRNWLATPDGYTLMRDAEGFLSFATGFDGRLVASEIRYDGPASVARAQRKGIAKNLLPDYTRIAKMRKANQSTQIEGTFPATGECKLLMLLVNFADTKPTYISQAFDAYMNTKGFAANGSFRDFYLDNSYGKLDITTTVTEWVTVPYPKSYYTTDNAETLILDALNIVAPTLDLTQFDNDGDGVLDGLAVIHQGSGAEASGKSDEIWSHSGVLYGKTIQGIKLQRYTIEPEILYDSSNPNTMSTIGVMCHEFGHNLGAPDFYDTDYLLSGGEYYGTGVWDLMGSGAWNGPNSSGTRPAGINMWQKIQLGWVEPELLTESKAVTGMKSADANAVAYRFDTTEPGEYFILENRQQAGWYDVSLPHHGLIIYHVNDNLIADNVVSNTLNVKYPQAMYTVCAGAQSDPSDNPGSYGWVNSNYAPFPGARDVKIFHDTSLPSAKSMAGRYSYKGLTQITENSDGTIDFQFLCYDMPESPVDLTAVVRGGAVTLDWKQPSSAKPLRYNVFRNGEKIGEVTTPGYTDVVPSTENNVTYAVDAVYASGLISPYSQVQIYLPANFISEVSSEISGKDVTLKWNLNTRLSRMLDMNDNFKTNDYQVESIEVAHRFRAEDLAIYRGYDIRYVNFLAVQPQSTLNVTVRVYEQDPATDELTLASERKVSEFANMQWTNAMLTKSVKISGEKDILIAVKYQHKKGESIQVLSDLSPAVPGMGNLSRINDGQWSEDLRADGNFFLAATLRAPEAAAGDAPVVKPIEDFLADTAYPQGFIIYHDGKEVGRTVGRSFVHTSDGGAHSYTLTCLYKGENESAGVEHNVLIDAPTGIDAPDYADGPRVMSRTGGVDIVDLDGMAIVANIAGVEVARVAASGSTVFVNLPAGIYLVVLPDHKVEKILVR